MKVQIWYHEAFNVTKRSTRPAAFSTTRSRCSPRGHGPFVVIVSTDIVICAELEAVSERHKSDSSVSAKSAASALSARWQVKPGRSAGERSP